MAVTPVRSAASRFDGGPAPKQAPSAIVESYQERTPASLREWSKYRRHLVDGNTRDLAYFPPHPLVIARGRGCTVVDLDGNSYYDLLNNYTALVHGNAHPDLLAAAQRAMELGTVFPAPHELQACHAQLLSARFEGADTVRYVNSGTEAAMLAVRVARAVTGREVVAKAQLGYHGSWEGLAVADDEDDQPSETAGRAPGIPACVHELVRTFVFNDADDLERVCEAAGSGLAAIVIEPLLGSGGCLPASREFLARARELATRTGALLVLDEVQSFRLGYGGMQGVLGCPADLTILGKLIGGGFPIGAVLGRRELLEVLSREAPRRISHSGTFNGNLVSLAAGIASLELLSSAAIVRLNLIGTTLADACRAALTETGLKGTVTGYGSMFNVHLGPLVERVENGRDAQRCDAEQMRLLHLALMNAGVFSAPRGFLNASTAFTDEDVSEASARIHRGLQAVASEVAG